MSPEIDETVLQAYVDGRLDAPRSGEVETWLAARPQEAQRVLAYQLQNEQLHERFDVLLDEALPPALLECAKNPPVRRVDRGIFAWSRGLALAASLLLAVISGVAGWLAHARWQPPALAEAMPIYRQAAVAHAVFVPDARRPVEVEQEEALVKWLSRRLGADIRAPHLAAQGYALVGGRLLPGQQGPVAQFMYQDAAGQRLTLYLSREGQAGGDTAFRFAREGGLNVFYWVDGEFGYALSASIDRAALGELARAVYAQLPGAGGADAEAKSRGQLPKRQ